MSELLDHLLGTSDEGMVHVEERDGFQFVPMTSTVYKCIYKSGQTMCYNVGPAGWICERQTGHLGQHLAWADSASGELYTNGIWTNEEGHSEDDDDVDEDYDDPDD